VETGNMETSLKQQISKVSTRKQTDIKIKVSKLVSTVSTDGNLETYLETHS
jgi:hypothetical protein